MMAVSSVERDGIIRLICVCVLNMHYLSTSLLSDMLSTNSLAKCKTEETKTCLQNLRYFFSKTSKSILTSFSGKQWYHGLLGKSSKRKVFVHAHALFLPLPRSHSEVLCSWIAILPVHHAVMSQFALIVPAPLSPDC